MKKALESKEYKNMRKKLIITLLTCISATPAFSGNGTVLWPIKAEIWQERTEIERMIYIQGIFDGIVFADWTLHGTKLSTDLTVSQYVNAIDTLYSDYKNSLIPVPFLLRIITLEVVGTEKAVVEKEIEAYRKQFSKQQK